MPITSSSTSFTKRDLDEAIGDDVEKILPALKTAILDAQIAPATIDAYGILTCTCLARGAMAISRRVA